MTEIKRVFRGKTIEFLITSKTILQSAFNHQTELIAEQTTLPTIINLQNIKARIEDAYQFIGGDKGGPQREATIVVNKMSASAKLIIAKMKAHIKIIYKTDATERTNLLKSLGFTKHLKGAQRSDQEAIISLLLMFKDNLTPAREAAFLAGGVPANQIAEIRGYATTLMAADIDQEILKGTSKELKENEIIILNSIHKDLMDIALIGKTAFRDRPSVYSQFVYTQVLSRINSYYTPKKKTPKTPPATDA